MLNLGIIVLILAIAFFQALHGLFSSLIMALCTVVCTVVAFNYYEALASLLYAHQPAYADAGALIALLVIPLLIIRVAVDNYLPGNVVLDVWVDRAGGAAFGLITALLLVGTLVVAMQMLPFERDVMGYDPFGDDLQPVGSLAVDAPGFTLGLVKTLSGGSMSGSRNFAVVHENLPLELWAGRNRISGARNDTLDKAFKVESLHDVTKLPYPGKDAAKEEETFDRYVPRYPGLEDQASRVYVARVLVTSDACDRDDWWRLTGTQFRLVTEEGRGYYPLGYLIFMDNWSVLTEPVGKVQINRPSSKGDTMLKADLLFRVPLKADGKPAKPVVLEFRRTAKKEIPGKIAATMPPTAGALKRKEVFGEVAVKGPGRVTVFRPTTAFVNPQIPSPFRNIPTTERQNNLSLRSGSSTLKAKIVGAHMASGEINGDANLLYNLSSGGHKEGGPQVQAFVEPQGKKVVKLVGKPIKGLLFAPKLAEIAMQAQVNTLKGDTGQLVGAWVKWDEGDRKFVHLYYAPDTDGTDDPSRISENLRKILDTYKTKRKQATEFGLIFLAPANSKVSSFRLTGIERFTCESPLSTSRAPRRPRKSRRH